MTGSVAGRVPAKSVDWNIPRPANGRIPGRLLAGRVPNHQMVRLSPGAKQNCDAVLSVTNHGQGWVRSVSFTRTSNMSSSDRTPIRQSNRPAGSNELSEACSSGRPCNGSRRHLLHQTLDAVLSVTNRGQGWVRAVSFTRTSNMSSSDRTPIRLPNRPANNERHRR
jgi:hypothetical protein